MVKVIDASVAIKWFVREEDSESALDILNDLYTHPHHFMVPELFFFELWSVLYRLIPSANLSRTQEKFFNLCNCGVERHPFSETLAQSSIEFIQRGLSGYDATYAGLAKLMNGKWITADVKAHRKIEDFKVSVLLSP